MKIKKKNQAIAILGLCILVILINGCGYGFCYEQKLIDPYYLVAPDVQEQLAIGYEPDSSGSYTIIIGSTIFAAGHNKDFIIAKQHPYELEKKINKFITNYYIIPIKNPVSESLYKNKIGPLTLDQFNGKRKELSIPDSLKFTIEFDDLK